MNPPVLIQNLDRCWTSLDELRAGLAAEQWATPSLCPGWTVRDVASHIASVEHMMSGEPPGSMTERAPSSGPQRTLRMAQDGSGLVLGGLRLPVVAR